MEDKDIILDSSSFKDEGENYFEFRKVDKGVRFANYFIDRIVVGILGTAIQFMFTFEAVASSTSGGDIIAVQLFSILIGFIVTVLFYTLIEGATGGRSLGKLITGTRAVNIDGSPIDFGKAMTRSLCRIVPFEPFSFFGDNGWHDAWTDTMVVNEGEYKAFHGY